MEVLPAGDSVYRTLVPFMLLPARAKNPLRLAVPDPAPGTPAWRLRNPRRRQRRPDRCGRGSPRVHRGSGRTAGESAALSPSGLEFHAKAWQPLGGYTALSMPGPAQASAPFRPPPRRSARRRSEGARSQKRGAWRPPRHDDDHRYRGHPRNMRRPDRGRAADEQIFGRWDGRAVGIEFMMEAGQRLAGALRGTDPHRLGRPARHATPGARDLVELAVHRPRTHLGDDYAGASQVGPERLAEPVDEVLARGVGRGRGQHGQARAGADVEDPAAAPANHVGHEARRQLHHCRDVGRHDRSVARPVRAIEELRVAEAGVVHQDVDRTGTLPYLGQRAIHLALVGQVGWHHQHRQLRVPGRETDVQFLEPFDASGEQDERAGPGTQLDRERTADPGRCTGQQDRSTVERWPHVCRHGTDRPRCRAGRRREKPGRGPSTPSQTRPGCCSRSPRRVRIESQTAGTRGVDRGRSCRCRTLRLRLLRGRQGPEDLLGGKGANLAEMVKLGLPVPPGFTITTEACRAYLDTGAVPEGLEAEIAKHLEALEAARGKKLGDPDDPLLVSVRSGAKFSMPGMMETVLNVGLTDVSVHGLAGQSDNARFAWARTAA